MTISDWIALGALIVSIVAPSVGFVYGTLNNKIVENEAAIKSIGLKLDEAKIDLAAFKLTVAKEYASVEHLESVETRILDGFKEFKKDLKEWLAELASQIKARG